MRWRFSRQSVRLVAPLRKSPIPKKASIRPLAIVKEVTVDIPLTGIVGVAVGGTGVSVG